MVVHVTRYEADDLNIRTGKIEFLGCWILEAICGYTNEELYSSLTVVRRVVQGVLKHKKFKATPSFVRHTVLVKLTQEDDVACLHKQVYQWQGHKVVFMRFTGLSCCGTSSMMFMARSVLCPAQIRSRHEIVAPASV